MRKFKKSGFLKNKSFNIVSRFFLSSFIVISFFYIAPIIINFTEIEKKIINILDTKVRPAVARDGGDIKFKEFKNGVVTVNLQGSCSGCPSSTMTLKQGVQNLLCHYLPEVKEVVATQ